MESSRILAVIMFTDIVGYTAMMSEDSAKALELVRINRDLQKPLVEKYNGTWLKEIGDGVMAQFSTALDAVNCAREIQRSSRADFAADIRIGIHLGDIAIENGDVYGDGVNVAARLESIADPGGIYISESVEKAIHGQSTGEAKFLGEVKLKNVGYNLRIYALQGDGLPIPAFQTNVKKIWNPSTRKLLIGILIILIVGLGRFAFNSSGIIRKVDRSGLERSIAVLPFINESSNQENQYFCNGIMGGILDHLAKIPDLTVISRTSVEQYRNNPPSLKNIAEELGVNYLVEGSVQRIEEEAIIFAQLIEASTARNLWSRKFERKLTDIFDVQAEITQEVADELKAIITPEVKERIESIPTSSQVAYDFYLQGQYHTNLASYDDIDSAIHLFNKAVQEDPGFAEAYSALAKAYITKYVDRDPDPVWSQNAYVAFQHALTIDPDLAEAYAARGMWYWTPGNNFQHLNAIRDCQKSLELKPGLSSAYELLSLVQLHVGLLDEALEMSQKGVELEPTNMWLRHFVGQVYFFQGNYLKALEMFDTVDERLKPYFRIAFSSLTLFHLGRTDEAVSMIQDGLERWPDEPQLNSTYAIMLAGDGAFEDARERMRVAEKNSQSLRHIHHLFHNLAAAEALMGQKAKAVEWLEAAAREGLPCYPLFQNDRNLDSLRDYPDFIDFMSRMHEKLEYYQNL
jgi:TolB-like protein/class 3 adenylate cyclase/Flp pilus assembly protein TadD